MILIRPNSRKKNYQDLADSLSAIEMPLFMAFRVSQIITTGDPESSCHDLEVDDLDIDSLKNTIQGIEIFPSGSHPSAFIQQKEGILDLRDRLVAMGKTVKIWWELPDFDHDVIPAYDMLPLEKYKAHNWHCWGGRDRQGYATVVTSFGCPFKCEFCCVGSYYGKYQERELVRVFSELDTLAERGIKNIKILDEMFFLNADRVERICDYIIANGYDFNIWAYARIDTINSKILKKMKVAGFNWLGIGIESGDEKIRSNNGKRFTNSQVKDIVKEVQDEAISIGANYIFGFPSDNMDSLKKTFSFAQELQTEYANFNPMMAFPGSKLYDLAVKKKWELPDEWSGYSYYSYDCHPIRTHHLTSREVLEFRDQAFNAYFTDKRYLSYMEKKFGSEVIKEIQTMTSKELSRKLCECQS